jgi:hypothetical protein
VRLSAEEPVGWFLFLTSVLFTIPETAERPAARAGRHWRVGPAERIGERSCSDTRSAKASVQLQNHLILPCGKVFEQDAAY